MSNLIRWEPMREMMTLREATERLFDDAFTRRLNLNGEIQTTRPCAQSTQRGAGESLFSFATFAPFVFSSKMRRAPA